MANNYGISPLMWACHWGSTKTVQLLISYGRKIDILKKSTEDCGYPIVPAGSTALDMAKKENYTDVVQLLEQYQNNPKETQKTLRNTQKNTHKNTQTHKNTHKNTKKTHKKTHKKTQTHKKHNPPPQKKKHKIDKAAWMQQNPLFFNIV